MTIFLNDQSIHEQFHTISDFLTSLQAVVKLKHLFNEAGIEVLANKSLLSVKVTKSDLFHAALQQMEKAQRLSIILWFTKYGPFWEDEKAHSPDEYLEARDMIVTDSAIAEAAWFNFLGTQRHLLSFSPSNWTFTPIKVKWIDGEGAETLIDVDNYWSIDHAETAIKSFEGSYNSWIELQRFAELKFKNLSFNQNTFEPLMGHPFKMSAAERIVALLSALDKLKTCFDATGARTQEGHEIYQKFFTGKKGDGGRGALFTDSSETEKDAFRSELTFTHPDKVYENLFCPYHGKIQTPQYRIHFSYPITHNSPLYIVYVGPKITV